MNVRTAWICCLLAGTVIFHCEGIQWLGIYRHSRPSSKDSPRKVHPRFTTEECIKARDSYGLKKRQFRYCKKDTLGNSMIAIVQAARLALYHCGKTVSDRRWNCSSALSLPDVRPDLQRGTREQAFVYAYASAAMVFAIARGCAMALISYCNCDFIPDNKTLPNDTYRWSDCHDNMETAKKYVIDFLGLRIHKSGKQRRLKHRHNYEREREDVYDRPPVSRIRRHQKRKRRRKKKRSVLKMMNNHNYLAGIRIMDRHRKLFCKCHGVSGSCSVRTCNLKLRRVDDQIVVRLLRDNYLKAIWVKKENDRLVPQSRSQSDIILPTDLVFVKHSPDYCQPDIEVGSLGTQGRRCNASMSGSFNCETMCCGRGYSILKQNVISDKCNCKFSSEKFQIVCDRCPITRTRHICN